MTQTHTKKKKRKEKKRKNKKKRKGTENCALDEVQVELFSSVLLKHSIFVFVYYKSQIKHRI
jgi:hypothetical protein